MQLHALKGLSLSSNGLDINATRVKERQILQAIPLMDTAGLAMSRSNSSVGVWDMNHRATSENKHNGIL